MREFYFLIKDDFFLWESAAADRDVIVAGSHSHRNSKDAARF